MSRGRNVKTSWTPSETGTENSSGCLITELSINVVPCPKKDPAILRSEANFAGFEAAIETIKDHFGILRFSAFFWAHLWENCVASISAESLWAFYRAYSVGHHVQPFHWLKGTPWTNLSPETGWSCWTSRRSNLLFSRTTPTALWRILNGKLSTTKVWQYELIKMHNVQDCIYFICSWKSQKIVHWCQNSRARSLASEAKWSVSITISILSCNIYFLLSSSNYTWILDIICPVRIRNPRK